MAYTIIRSDGNVLATIQDGTINTSNTSLGLPGRNYAGYGQTLDTNFVRMLENFANDSVPANPIRGQLWFNTTNSTLSVCPTDGETNASSWIVLATTTSAGDTTLGNVTVTGNITANNLAVSNLSDTDRLTVRIATVSANLTAANANISTANLTTTRTAVITTGSSTTAGTLTGSWTLTGNASGNAMVINTGNLRFGSSAGIYTDNYYWANGTNILGTIGGAYTNDDVFNYLTGSNSVTQFTGNIAPARVTTSYIAGGGTIANVWTLATGARIQATYADLAERYAADGAYRPGTVVEIGGTAEVTAVQEELSDNVFGVVSENPAYVMNATAGEDDTHPMIALAGRVNVMAIGKVMKGDRLVSAGQGKARAGTKEELTPFNVIGRALENKNDDGIGLVKAVVIIK